MAGCVTFNRVPDGASLYGNLIVRPDTVPTGETGEFRIQVKEVRGDLGQISTTLLDELNVTVDDADNGAIVSSGWTEITSVSNTSTDAFIPRSFQASVSGGTLETRDADDFAVLFEWRVD